MRSFPLQNRITIRGLDENTIVQAESEWLDLEAFADLVVWIEVTEVTKPTVGEVRLILETAPAKLDALFVPVDTVDGLVPSTTPLVRKIFLNGAGGVPLARYLRWKLKGTGGGTWDATFQLHITVGEGIRNAFSPRSLPGLVLWLRADQGVLLSGNNVTDWKDLSGNNNHVTQPVAGSRPVLRENAIGGRSAIDFSSSRFLQNNVNTIIGASGGGQPYSVLCVARQGNGTLFSLRQSLNYSASMFFLNLGGNTYAWSDGATANRTVANTLPTTSTSITGFKSCHRYQGAGNAQEFFLNAASLPLTGGSNQTIENGTPGFQVGVNAQAVPEYWNGTIAEIIVTSNAIDPADRVRVETYQKDFFGI